MAMTRIGHRRGIPWALEPNHVAPDEPAISRPEAGRHADGTLHYLGGCRCGQTIIAHTKHDPAEQHGACRVCCPDLTWKDTIGYGVDATYQVNSEHVRRERRYYWLELRGTDGQFHTVPDVEGSNDKRAVMRAAQRHYASLPKSPREITPPSYPCGCTHATTLYHEHEVQP